MPTILDAHGTNASPDGLCTRTHTNEAFSCWFCCNSFRVGGGRCGNVCLVDQVNSPSPTDQPVRKFKDGLAISMTMKNLFTFRTYLFFGTHTASTTDGVNRTRPKRTMLKAASKHPWVRRSLSVPDDVKRKRKKAMAVAESERVAKRDREEAIQGERDHQEYMERLV